MASTTPETRAAILARLIAKAPEKKLGRTAVMKLMYFLQELKRVPLGYRFRLFTYGPFDSEVLSDLATATSLNTLTEETKIYPRGYGFEIMLGTCGEGLSQELERSNSELASQIDAVVKEFGAFGAAELELRSTILFVQREISQKGATWTNRTLAERVRQVKPHFTESTIEARIEEMKTKGLFRDLARA